jgi:hypothetical protein
MLGLLVTMLAMAASAGAAPDADQAGEKAAVRQAVLDYAEGFYDHAPDRMARAISPLLTKRAVVARPGTPAFLTQMNSEMLVEATRGSAPRPSAEDRKMVVEVLDVEGDIASARVFSVLFNDYIHLVKRDGRWQLVSVLWHQPQPPAPSADAATTVEQALRDYLEAMAAGDRGRLLGRLSPVAAVRALVSAPSGARVIRDQNAESVASMSGAGQMPKSAAPAAIAVLGVDGDIASAKFGAGSGTTYVHLGQFDGKWLVVNTLTAVGGR